MKLPKDLLPAMWSVVAGIFMALSLLAEFHRHDMTEATHLMVWACFALLCNLKENRL